MSRRSSKKDSLPPSLRALRTLGIIIVLFLLYAYSTQALEINLQAPFEIRRQESVLRAIRGLARPDIFTFAEESRSMNITVRMPCGEDIRGSQVTLGERTITLSPNCASTTQEILTAEGTGFRPYTGGIIRWYPPGEVATTRALTRFRTDGDGNFTVEFTMSDIRPTEEPQRIEVEEKWNTGITGLSDASWTAISGITETILMALFATTLGIILAIPISFIAARNLMINVGSPLASVMAGIVALPIGYWVGREATRFVFFATEFLNEQALISCLIGIVAATAVWFLLRFIAKPDVEGTSWQERLMSIVYSLLAAAAAIFAIGTLGTAGMALGGWLEPRLGIFSFIGGFLALVSEFALISAPVLIGLLVGLLAASYASRYAQEFLLRSSTGPARIATIILASLGTAVIVLGIGLALTWLYQFDQPQFWTTYPAIGGLVVGAIWGALMQPKRIIPVGFVSYTIVRSILNIIRSIEPLVYVIIFAVWVGIGPFAGVLALTLHTVAALGKLFSEQVENISSGPLEAITATGANRLQTIVFAVIPQIVPPYIAFTLYRWDINVRMSTIIGFGGGGGIGFVLAQAINLLRYREASVMMIAIAVVVISLDYISSKVRERIL